MHFFLDFCCKSVYKGPHPAQRGRFLERRSSNGARCGVLRRRLVTDVVGGSGKTPLGWSVAPEPKKPRVERREAGVPSAKGFARRLASATVPGTTARVLPPSRLSALPPPPSSGWMDEGKSQTPGAMRRGNDQARVAPGLFDIVKCECGARLRPEPSLHRLQQHVP